MARPTGAAGAADRGRWPGDGTLAELLPAGVEFVAAHELASGSVGLHPMEAEIIARATPARRDEFAKGRSCARAALRRLGRAAGAIPVGPDREPVWPDGVVGSITHCPNFCAAAVARRSSFDGLGIDVERNAALARVRGRWSWTAEHVFTAAWITAEGG